MFTTNSGVHQIGVGSQWPIHQVVPVSSLTLNQTWEEMQKNITARVLSIDVIELILADKTLTCRPKKPTKDFKDATTFKMGLNTFGDVTQVTLLQNGQFTHSGYVVSWGKIPKAIFSSSPILEIRSLAHWAAWTYKINVEMLLAARQIGEEKREIPGFFEGSFNSETTGSDGHNIINQEIKEPVTCTLK